MPAFEEAFRTRGILALLAIMTFTVGALAAETPGGTQIPNTAAVSVANGSERFVSNTVNVMVRSTATIEFLKYAPRPESGGESVPVPPTAFDQGGGNFIPIPPPPPTLNPTVPLLGSPLYYLGETLYLRLTDPDQNRNPAGAETVLVTIASIETGDTEVLRLTETGQATGTFTGYLPTFTNGAIAADGRLLVVNSCHLRASYRDRFDNTDVTADTSLIDPYGLVFDSLTGDPLDGAIVTLFDVISNTPATVYGDDGISRYPATVTTGGIVTDAGGHRYQLPAGSFRFPYVTPGTYRLLVTPPAGYTTPSTVADAQLLTVRPDATLVTGSRGEDFVINPGPALRVDIPADPRLNYLWLQKFVSDAQATVGDFLQYRLELENLDANVTAPSVSIHDQLPPGLRYQRGSSRIDQDRQPDPAISADGRTLTFRTGNLPPNGKIVVTYVVEVAAGAKPGEAINVARATDRNGTPSNQAKATVKIRELFFGSSTFLAGRVLTGSCGQDDADMQGVDGVRLYLEDSTYVVSDPQGRFHFEGLEPGTHVLQLDLDSIPPGYEALPCQTDSRFAGRTFSQFVDLRGGTLWQTNFYIAPKPLPSGHLGFNLESSLKGADIHYRLPIENRDIALTDLQATLVLPDGVQLLPGSLRVDGAPVPLPPPGATLLLPLGDLPAGSRRMVELEARDSGMNSGELLAKAMLTFALPDKTTQRTQQAENRIIREVTENRQQLPDIVFIPQFPTFVADLDETDLIRLHSIAKELAEARIARVDVIGHTDDVPIAAASRHIHADNQALSEARATTVARALGEMLKLVPSQITISGRGDREPLSLAKTPESRALNRRVELRIVAEKISTAASRLPATPGQAVEMSINPSTPSPPASKPTTKTGEAVSTSRIKQPVDGARLTEQVMQVQILLDSQLTPKLRLDGEEISKDRIGFIRIDPKTRLTAYNYVGVDFGKMGPHVLSLEGLDPFGNVRFSATSKVVRTGRIRIIEQIAGPENLADGITPVEIKLLIKDVNHEPFTAPLKLQLIDGTLRPLIRKDETPGSLPEQNQQLIEVDQHGIARFAATTQAGRHTATLAYDDVMVEIETWLKPKMRDWILVGFAEGTVGYQTLSGNLTSLRDAGLDEHGYTDGRVKFFAKGAVKGEWLLTLAYDSDKPDLDGDSLQQIIDPDTYYPLYGDETRQGYEAASARDIYVKLERGQFYALFGDMQTNLTQTELAKYVRSLNGFKSELQGEHFDYTVFAAETKQAFVKDEIRGDGTSGRYRLSQRDLVINSEQVTIETRDRFHPEKTIREEPLSRHVDYDIDYDAGTLYFKRPVPSKDQNLDPVFIVVRYETRGTDRTYPNYGGRAAVKFLDQRIEAGASHLHEENGVAEGNLYGADLTVKLTPKTVLHAEAATSKVESLDADNRKGEAWLAEINHAGEQVTARGYVREQEASFGLGQQNGGDSGMRTYGVDGTYTLAQDWSLTGEIYRQENLETVAKRDVGELEMHYRGRQFGLMAGAREARDRFADGETQRSRQVLMGGDVMLFKRLTLRATHDQSLMGSDESADFPTRTLLGADLRLTGNLSLFAEQEVTWGDREDTEGTRVGFKSKPWTGGTLTSAIEREMTENGERLFALFGLGQSWQVSERWSVGASLDRSYTLKHPGNDRINVNVPQASGSDEDFTAVSVGATCQEAKWSWSNRLEYRESDSEEKFGVSSGLVGELREGLAASAKLMAFFTDATDSTREEEELTLGLAWRPDNSRWMMLERLDLERTDDEDDNAGSNSSWRIVNHLHANYRPNRQWQASAYYGLKYVRATFDGDRYDGFTDLLAGETRYNLTKIWDIGVNGAALHSWNSNQLDYSAGASVGFQALTNTWVSAGYNFAGFEDDDFSDASYTADGPYVKFRVKFDQQTVKEAVEWLSK